MQPTQNGEPICRMFSTTTLEALPTVSGMGLAKVVEDPPAVPAFCDEKSARIERVRIESNLTWELLKVSHQTCPLPSMVPPPYKWILLPDKNQKVVLENMSASAHQVC